MGARRLRRSYRRRPPILNAIDLARGVLLNAFRDIGFNSPRASQHHPANRPHDGRPGCTPLLRMHDRDVLRVQVGAIAGPLGNPIPP